MVVALGTVQTHPEKNLGDSLGALIGGAEGAVIIRGGDFVGTAQRGDDLAGEAVERLVFVDGFTDPAVEGGDASGIEDFFLDAEEVGPFQGPEVGELGTLEEGVDQFGPFVRIRVLKKGPCLLLCRDEPEKIEMDAPDEGGVVADF